jgi:anaerobic magnesium-protoporphyrin IX monomethyl ester cyclase
MEICDEIVRRRLKVEWECLSRVDTIDAEVAQKMKKAGCVRVFFGIESGNDSVLALMNKQVTSDQAREAVQIAKSAEIQTGAFFIVGYPGETDDTVLETIRFASSLPLDYLSFTLPYPIPGTPLYERVKTQLLSDDLEEPKRRSLVDHRLLYHGSFSEFKLKFAIMKAMAQFRLRKNLGVRPYRLLGEPFEVLTDSMFRILR